MGKYEAADAPWWTRLRLMEPAVLRGIILALVTAGAVWGLEWSETGEKIIESYGALFAIVPLVQAWWTRTVVSPSNGSTMMADG